MAEGLDDALLVGRGKARENLGRLHRLGQLFVGHVFHRASENDLPGVQAHVLADLARHQIIVAGEDLDRHPIVLQGGDSLAGGFLGRIEEGDVTFQNQF